MLFALISTQLGLCPEASTHVEQMKDTLLAISNEILDNTYDLGPDHVEQLHQKRFAFPSLFNYIPFFFALSYLENDLASSIGCNTLHRKVVRNLYSKKELDVRTNETSDIMSEFFIFISLIASQLRVYFEF